MAAFAGGKSGLDLELKKVKMWSQPGRFSSVEITGGSALDLGGKRGGICGR